MFLGVLWDSGVVCGLPTCVNGSPVSTSAGTARQVFVSWVCLFVLLEWELLLVAVGGCVSGAGLVLWMASGAGILVVDLLGPPRGHSLVMTVWGFLGLLEVICLVR